MNASRGPSDPLEWLSLEGLESEQSWRKRGTYANRVRLALESVQVGVGEGNRGETKALLCWA